MTETDPEKRLIGYACISTYRQILDTQLSRAHLRRRRRSGIGRLTDPTAAALLWLRAGPSCPIADTSLGHRPTGELDLERLGPASYWHDLPHWISVMTFTEGAFN